MDPVGATRHQGDGLNRTERCMWLGAGLFWWSLSLSAAWDVVEPRLSLFWRVALAAPVERGQVETLAPALLDHPL